MAFITDIGMTGVEDSAIGANMKEVQEKLPLLNRAVENMSPFIDLHLSISFL